MAGVDLSPSLRKQTLNLHLIGPEPGFLHRREFHQGSLSDRVP
jgi:hypothetical protein